MHRLRLFLIFLFLASAIVKLNAQPIEMEMQKQMVALEHDVVRIYNELQKYLLTENQNENELLAFEALITIYVDDVLDLYDTYYRIKGTTLESHQEISARCLIFRALTYLERAKTNPENYKKACEDYKRALLLARNHLQEPLLSTKLPYEVWTRGKLYTRLADLLDNRHKNFQMVDCFKMSNVRRPEEDHK